MQEWERLTERLGFWINLDEAYVTYHQSYVESVWWSLKNLFDRGLLYQGHKIVWWWAQGGTALSARRSRAGISRSGGPERVCAVSAGGRAARASSDGTVSNVAPRLDDDALDAAEQSIRRRASRLDYATVVDSETGQRLIMAAALVETIAGKVKRELTLNQHAKART